MMGADEHPERKDEEAGGPGLAEYRDREHQAAHARHPEGEGGADLGEVHEAIEEDAGAPGLAEYRDREHQAAHARRPEGEGGADLGHVHEAIDEDP